MRILILKKELSNNAALYSSMTAAQVAAELNKTISVTKSVRITTLGVLDLLGSTSGAIFLKALETTAASNDAVRYAIRSMDTVGVDAGNSYTQAMLDQLVSASVLNATDVATIKNSAVIQTTRAIELGLGVVRTGEVTRARAA